MSETLYTYVILHVPTGAKVIRTQRGSSRLAFLELLNRWNRNQPGVWVHYEEQLETP